MDVVCYRSMGLQAGREREKKRRHVNEYSRYHDRPSCTFAPPLDPSLFTVAGKGEIESLNTRADSVDDDDGDDDRAAGGGLFSSMRKLFPFFPFRL